jgi:hypothetical protein
MTKVVVENMRPPTQPVKQARLPAWMLPDYDLAPLNPSSPPPLTHHKRKDPSNNAPVKTSDESAQRAACLG